MVMRCLISEQVSPCICSVLTLTFSIFKKLFFFSRKRTYVSAPDGQMCPAAKSEEKMDIIANTKVEKLSLLYYCSVQHTRFGRNSRRELNEFSRAKLHCLTTHFQTTHTCLRLSHSGRLQICLLCRYFSLIYFYYYLHDTKTRKCNKHIVEYRSTGM